MWWKFRRRLKLGLRREQELSSPEHRGWYDSSDETVPISWHEMREMICSSCDGVFSVGVWKDRWEHWRGWRLGWVWVRLSKTASIRDPDSSLELGVCAPLIPFISNEATVPPCGGLDYLESYALTSRSTNHSCISADLGGSACSLQAVFSAEGLPYLSLPRGPWRWPVRFLNVRTYPLSTLDVSLFRYSDDIFFDSISNRKSFTTTPHPFTLRLQRSGPKDLPSDTLSFRVISVSKSTLPGNVSLIWKGLN